MSDIQLIESLKKLVPDVQAEIHNDQCVSLSFSNPEHPWFGIIRHHKDKPQILRLISQCENLKSLDLRKCRIPFLPTLPDTLEYLDIGSNYLGSIPDLSHLRRLKYLNVGVNNLTEFPHSILELPLTTLKVHKNQIKGIPSKLPTTIRWLNIYLNRVSKLDEDLYGIPDMEYFSCGFGGFKRLPEAIGRWKGLTWLSVVLTPIRELPGALTTLPRLRGARLSKNHLECLPENIGDLAALRDLSLNNNRLKSLPDSFYRLNLDRLNLSENPITDIGPVTAKWLVQ